MKEIKLAGGYVVMVDDEDFDYLNQWTWRVRKTKYTNYARRSVYLGNHKTKDIHMHRAIMNPPDNMQVDHIDHNGLNNQKSNLRICTPSENRRNVRIKVPCSSVYKGVCRHIDRWDGGEYLSYYCSISIDRHGIFLGSFKEEVDAAIAYDLAAIKYHGEFACLNFPDRMNDYKSGRIVVKGRDIPGSSSRYTGVSWHKETSKWKARIVINGSRISIGYFETEEEAAMAIDITALNLLGDRAVLNFPERLAEYIQVGADFIEEKKSKIDKTSRYLGVCWSKSNKRWAACVARYKQRHRCGYFDSEVDAAIARDKEAIKLYGPSAKLNFPEKINEYLCLANGTKKVLSVNLNKK